MSASSIAARSSRGKALKGRIRVPGDKSISHRSLILGLLSIGETHITGLLEGDDIKHTAAACQALGASVIRKAEGNWIIKGAGIGGLREPEAKLDFGNAGTGSRLMMGVTGSHPIITTFDGDESLRLRPMKRILDPLILMGTRILSQNEGERLPLTIQGPDMTIPLTYTLPVPSAQIKSAILLAGLNSPGITTIIEPQPSRDHTERMLSLFGAQISCEKQDMGGNIITLQGQPELHGCTIEVPSDPSSAAFPLVAALIIPGSDIILENIMMNPARTGLIRTLLDMGADITCINEREVSGETVADLHIRHSSLKGVDVPAERAPSMIDEYPVLAVAAAFAQGTTTMHGLHELKVKESDRLAAISQGLEQVGVPHEIKGDDLIVEGLNGEVPGGGEAVRTWLDHRIAMSFLVLGLASRKPVMIDDIAMIATSFPAFIPLMQQMGADIELSNR